MKTASVGNFAIIRCSSGGLFRRGKKLPFFAYLETKRISILEE